MIDYFFSKSDPADSTNIIEILNQKKEKIKSFDYSDAFVELEHIKGIISKEIDYAKLIGDEVLANSAFIVYKYIALFCNLAAYFQSLNEAQYAKSWNLLQNCLDLVIVIGKFVDSGNRYDVPDIVELLVNYERLYPYKVFASTEMTVTRSHCSICGLSMLSLLCPHIKGNLYWGEIALEVIDDVKLKAVALVSHPLDKRCVMTLSDDDRPEEEKFALLHFVTQSNLNPLVRFSVESQSSLRLNSDIKAVGRNKACTCGSGMKFKKCCLSKLYYEHVHNIIHLDKPVEFHLF